jgi:hypothetical protein
MDAVPDALTILKRGTRKRLSAQGALAKFGHGGTILTHGFEEEEGFVQQGTLGGVSGRELADIPQLSQGRNHVAAVF